MKLESEAALLPSTLGQKPVSKTYDTDGLDSGGLNLKDQIMKEKDLIILDDVKDNARDIDELPPSNNGGNGWVSCNNVCSGVVYGMDHDNELQPSLSRFDQSWKVESFEKGSEWTLPELTVCYKEQACNVVKDICIDEGVPSQDKFLSECSVDEKAVCTVQFPNWDQTGEWHELLQNVDIHAVDNLTPSKETLSDNDSLDEHESIDQIQERGTDCHQIGISSNDFADILYREPSETGPPSQFFNTSRHEVEQQSVEIEKANSADVASVSEAGESKNGAEDGVLANLAPSVVVEEQKLMYDSSSNSKAENGSIAFNFSSFEPSSIGRMECHEKTDSTRLIPSDEVNCQASAETGSSPVRGSIENDNPSSSESEKISRVEDRNPTTLSAFSHLQHDAGETSFSGAPLASLINYSGPVAYSGSLSLRSDSSTTSTRSFAFPILQSEWNGSPIKMVKANRRQFWKHGGWRQGFFCCRF